MRWRDAFSLKIREEANGAVVGSYRLAFMLWELVLAREYAGRPIKLPNRPVDRAMFTAARRAMIDRQILQEDSLLPGTVLRIPGRKDTDPMLVQCEIDPFGHIAYLSAMAYHGLTNRLPRVLYFRTLDPTGWANAAKEKMSKDIGEKISDYLTSGLPALRHVKLERLSGLVIETIRSKEAHAGWRHAGDQGLRVASIGRVFLDMVQRPDLCGGLQHVIGIFEEHARTYLDVILSEISRHGSKIDQARAGYILEEYCGVNHSSLDEWAKDAARGGSRRLDPQAEYVPTYSERWCLSINA